VSSPLPTCLAIFEVLEKTVLCNGGSRRRALVFVREESGVDRFTVALFGFGSCLLYPVWAKHPRSGPVRHQYNRIRSPRVHLVHTFFSARVDVPFTAVTQPYGRDLLANVFW
jgi:hypothetical protein